MRVLSSTAFHEYILSPLNVMLPANGRIGAPNGAAAKSWVAFAHVMGSSTRVDSLKLQSCIEKSPVTSSMKNLSK